MGERPGNAGQHLTPGGTDLLLVVPVYNEAENFPRLYESLRTHVLTPWRLKVVYDREEDTTVPVARAIAAQDARVELLLNAGKGVLGALRTGLAEADHGFVVVTMADGSDDHRQVDQMVALAREGYDLVAASRYMRGGAQLGGPLLKSALSRTAGLSLRWLAGVGTADATSNFKLYRAEFLKSVKIESRGGFEVALELTVKAHLRGLRIGELPTTWAERTSGKSNFQLRKWFLDYLRWYLAAFRSRAP